MSPDSDVLAPAFYMIGDINDPQNHPEWRLWDRKLIVCALGMDFRRFRINLQAAAPDGVDTSEIQLAGSINSHGLNVGWPDNPFVKVLKDVADNDVGYGDAWMRDLDGTITAIGNRQEYNIFNLYTAWLMGMVIGTQANAWEWDLIYADDCFTEYPDYHIRKINRQNHSAQLKEAWPIWRDRFIDSIRYYGHGKDILGNIMQPEPNLKLDGITIEHPRTKDNADRAFAGQFAYYGNLGIAWYEPAMANAVEGFVREDLGWWPPNSEVDKPDPETVLYNDGD